MTMGGSVAFRGEIADAVDDLTEKGVEVFYLKFTSKGEPLEYDLTIVSEGTSKLMQEFEGLISLTT